MYEEWCVQVGRAGPGRMRRWYHWLESIADEGGPPLFPPWHNLSSNLLGAFLLGGSPTSISPALLVTFVQNTYNCSSARIPLSVSIVIDATCWPSWQTRFVLQSSGQVVGMLQQYFAQHDPVGSEPSSPYWARPTYLASSHADWSTVQLLMVLPTASLSSIWYGTCFEHRFCHCHLIRRNTHCLRWRILYKFDGFVWCRHTAHCFSMPLAVTFHTWPSQ